MASIANYGASLHNSSSASTSLETLSSALATYCSFHTSYSFTSCRLTTQSIAARMSLSGISHWERQRRKLSLRRNVVRQFTSRARISRGRKPYRSACSIFKFLFLLPQNATKLRASIWLICIATIFCETPLGNWIASCMNMSIETLNSIICERSRRPIWWYVTGFSSFSFSSSSSSSDSCCYSLWVLLLRRCRLGCCCCCWFWLFVFVVVFSFWLFCRPGSGSASTDVLAPLLIISFILVSNSISWSTASFT